MIKKLVFYSLLRFGNALQAVTNVSPDTVSSISTFSIDIYFDETVGNGGMISIIVPDRSATIAEDFTESSLNKDLEFNDPTSLSCYSGSLTLLSCTSPGSN